MGVNSKGSGSDLIVRPNKEEAIEHLARIQCDAEIEKEWEEREFGFSVKTGTLFTCAFVTVLEIFDDWHLAKMHPLGLFSIFLFSSFYFGFFLREPAYRFLFPHYLLFQKRGALQKLPRADLEGQVLLLKKVITERGEDVGKKLGYTIAAYGNERRLIEAATTKLLARLSDESDTRAVLQNKNDKVIERAKDGRDEVTARKERLERAVNELIVRLDMLLPRITTNRAFVPLVDRAITEERWARIEGEIDDVVKDANALFANIITPTVDLDHPALQARPSAARVIPITRAIEGSKK